MQVTLSHNGAAEERRGKVLMIVGDVQKKSALEGCLNSKNCLVIFKYKQPPYTPLAL
jgi:hypothetical protein